MRSFWIALKIAAIVLVTMWLLEQPGGVEITWQSYQVNLSVGIAILIILAIAVIYSGLDNLLRILRSVPQRLFGTNKERRLEKGLSALSESLLAIAGGEPIEARKKAQRATKYLEDPALNHLLLAQAAQAAGKPEEARQHYQDMLLEEKTVQLGLRGLLKQSLQNQDETTARAILEEGYGRGIRTDWLMRTLFDLLARNGRWSRALEILEEARKVKVLDKTHNKTLAQQHKAVVLLAQASEAVDVAEAESLAVKAHDLWPHFAPVAVFYADKLRAIGKARKARAVIMTAWKALPHPLLVTALDTLYGQKGSGAKLKAFEKLVSLQPNHYLSHLALGKTAMTAGFWGVAQDHLKRSYELRPLQETYDGWVELQQKDTAPLVIKPPLPETSFPAPPTWRCQESGLTCQQWHWFSPFTGGFNTLVWEENPEDQAALGAGSSKISLLAERA